MSWYKKFLIIISIILAGVIVILLPIEKHSDSPQTLPQESTLPTPLEKTISIGWVGDMVPADTSYNETVLDFVAEQTRLPDLMIGNLEGTFAQEGRVSKCTFLSSRCHAFRGSPNFADSLARAGFDVISLVNNHSLDYGFEGLRDTEEVLRVAGIPFISQTSPTLSLEKNGKTVGILGVSTTPPARLLMNYEFIQEEIAKLRLSHDVVILILHGGSEGNTKTLVTGEYEFLGNEPRGNVEYSARVAIDAGADIVLGAGPHVLRKIEYYNGGIIVYSSGNFVGGNGRLLTRDNLGISGIFTVFVSNKEPRLRHHIDSVVLSRAGIPTRDPLEKGRLIVEALSN